MSSTEQINSGQIVDIQQLNDEEKKIFIAEKMKKYILTISICVMYGLIALILFIIATFTSYGSILYNDLAPFTITYIIGTIIIIVFLANEIYNFKPRKFENKLGYDAEMCPDYWKLQYVTDSNPKDSKGDTFFKNANVNTLQFKYKCVLDENLFDKSKFIELDNAKNLDSRLGYKYGDKKRLYVEMTSDKDKKMGNLATPEMISKFKEVVSNMNGYNYSIKENSLTKRSDNSDVLKPLTGEFTATNVPLACDTVYPVYLASEEADNNRKNPYHPKNLYRCAYSKMCGVPWSEAGCV